jgi:predicted nucleic acid-binding protein
MARIVADSSALILLAKCSLLKIVCELFDVIVPEAVRLELASEDLVKKYPDAALIFELMSKGSIKLHNPAGDLLAPPLSLHTGEKDALRLAIELNDSLFATDDGKAIKAARFFNIPFIVTPKIVVELFRLRKISFRKSHEALRKLDQIGRYSPEIIAEALISLMEKKNGKADNNKDI